MKFCSIFDIFSRRNEVKDDNFITVVPVTLRNKILLFCHEVFSNSRSNFGGDDYTSQMWAEIHQFLQYRHGKLQLTENSYPGSKTEDVISFLLQCKDEEFLDFVEYIFKVEGLFHVRLEENEIVREINELFASENAGYELTEMVKEEVKEPANVFPFGDREVTKIKTVAYPTVIKKDNQVTYSLIQKPALTFLANPKFKTANQEYLEALEDYRKGDYGNCLINCGSAFESVMKIICDEKGWSYKQTDTSSKLIKTIVDNTGLDSYFEQPLIIISTLRNRLSKAHGAGTQPKSVPQHLAKFALNSTASAIVLLVDEAS